jgi:hypothetical protein
VRADAIPRGQAFERAGITYMRVELPVDMHPDRAYVYAVNLATGNLYHFILNTLVMPLSVVIE